MTVAELIEVLRGYDQTRRVLVAVPGEEADGEEVYTSRVLLAVAHDSLLLRGGAEV